MPGEWPAKPQLWVGLGSAYPTRDGVHGAAIRSQENVQSKESNEEAKFFAACAR